MITVRDEHPKRSGTHPLGRTEFIRRLDSLFLTGFGEGFAVVFVRLSNLYTYEHRRTLELGDELLDLIASEIDLTDAAGLLVRYTVGSFVFVAPLEMVSPIVELICSRLAQISDGPAIKAKAGYVACWPSLSAEGAIERARFAYDAIKFKPTVVCQCFDAQLQTSFEKRNYVIDRLDSAIANSEIRVYAQPIVRLLTGQVCEVECLARWESPEYGSLSPIDFIPELERQQLIHKLDIEVVRRACAQWSVAHELGVNVPFGINLSRLDFELCDIYSAVREAMAAYDVPVNQVHIEITETALSLSRDTVWEGVQRFRDAGFEIYLDDFGTGYSSLEALEHLDFDVVKIDMSLLNGIDESERARVVIADVVSMVKRLGMQTLCEGVETEEQLTFLRAVGCEKAQGYLFSRPLSHDEAVALLQQDASQFENVADDSYYDAVGQVNLLDGTSASVHGVEAATFLGHDPIGIVELSEDGVSLLASNAAYHKLMRTFGCHDFDDFVRTTMMGTAEVHIRAIKAHEQAKKTGKEQSFDFVMGSIYCKTEARLIASSGGRDAFLNRVTLVDSAGKVTDSVLLAGILNAESHMIYWKDNEERFLGANESFLNFFGFCDLGEILGCTDAEKGWCDDMDSSVSDDRAVLRDGVTRQTRGVCQSALGMRKFVALKRPLYAGGKVVGLVGSIEDLGPAPDAVVAPAL